MSTKNREHMKKSVTKMRRHCIWKRASAKCHRNLKIENCITAVACQLHNETPQVAVECRFE